MLLSFDGGLLGDINDISISRVGILYDINWCKITYHRDGAASDHYTMAVGGIRYDSVSVTDIK